MQSLRHASSVEIAKELDLFKRKWNRITQIYQEHTELWQQLTPQHFAGILAIAPSKPGDIRLFATTLGNKEFAISLSSKVLGDELYGRVTANIVDHTGKPRLPACEVLIDAEGQVLSPEGERLIDIRESDSPGYRLLAEIVYKVIAH